MERPGPPERGPALEARHLRVPATPSRRNRGPCKASKGTRDRQRLKAQRYPVSAVSTTVRGVASGSDSVPVARVSV